MTLREQVDQTLANWHALRPKLPAQVRQQVSEMLAHLQPKDPKPGSFWQDPTRAAQARLRMTEAAKARWATKAPAMLDCTWADGTQDVLLLTTVAQRVALSPPTLLQRLSRTPTLHLTDRLVDQVITVTRSTGNKESK